MKNPPLLWIAPLLLITLLLWLSAPDRQRKDTNTAATDKSVPNWRAEHVDQWQIRPNGHTSHITAINAWHFDATAKTRLRQPHGLMLQRSGWYAFRSGSGTLLPNRIQLYQRVELTHQPADQTSPLRLISDRLDYDASRHLISSTTRVKISDEHGWTQGVGLNWWLRRQQLSIFKDVISEYYSIDS